MIAAQEIPRQTRTDAVGRTVHVPLKPQRIVSLCPSQTETLFTLCSSTNTARVVGVTKFCVHPAAALATATKVGGTKDVHYDTIDALAPDLIICEKEENTPEIVNTLTARGHAVYVTDITDVATAIESITTLGQLCGAEQEAVLLRNTIQSLFKSLEAAVQAKSAPPRTVAYLIWRKPWMVAGSNTYIHSVLTTLGLVNVFASAGGARYPIVAPEQLGAAQPELVFLSSEPYPFQDKHIAEVQALAPTAKVLLVDGEMFSWYGVRMVEAAAYLRAFVQHV